MGYVRARKSGRTPRQKQVTTDKQELFAKEYVVDFNGTQAAIRAGYPKSRAQVTASELLRRPNVQAMIGKYKGNMTSKIELRAEDALRQLLYCVTRVAGDFFGPDGKILPVHEMSERAQSVIDGFDQDVETWTDDAGEVHERVKTRVKLVPKAQAIDMTLKHFGEYAPDKHLLAVSEGPKIDWSQGTVRNVDEQDPVEKLIEDLSTKEQNDVSSPNSRTRHDSDYSS